MDLQKLKRLNLRQPKYIFPLVIFLPLLGLISSPKHAARAWTTR